ncbi:MAG TPA: hypothetical protein VFD04_18570 [Actinomycetes bacterium]|jgi:hypothetical protein|nr:hypothetical protein [Actinomycetes bacterium]
MAADLGHSLALVDGDLVLEGGNLAEVSGLPNLVQALALRVLTPLGSDQFNTGYGFDAENVFTQPASARTVRDLLTLNLVRTLGTDDRVREVRDVVFLDPAEAHRRRSWTVEVSIVTIGNQPETFTLRLGA